jgi:hypothetical protein
MAAHVFVSYARKDRMQVLPWVQQLQQAGVSIWQDEHSIYGALQWGQEIVAAIEECKVLLLILSPASAASGQVAKEVTLAAEAEKPILPLLLEPVTIPRTLRYHLAGIQQIELFSGTPAERLDMVLRSLIRLGAGTEEWSQPPVEETSLPGASKDTDSPKFEGTPCRSTPRVKPARTALRVVLLYKRNAQPDIELLHWLESEFKARGLSVFVDRHLEVGVEWANEIARQIRAADAVIPLLSAASVYSEMLAYEVQTAHKAAQEQEGRPRLLPVRISYTGPLPEPLGPILAPLQYTLWEGQDNERLADELVHALQNPPDTRPEALRETLEPVGGAVPLDSRFYIIRPTDERFLSAIQRRESIVLVKGARQMGKTSLLARGLQKAREAGANVVLTDFQALNRAHLESLETLFVALATWITDQLDLNVQPARNWDPLLGPNRNFERFMEREVLGKLEGPLVWGLDEVDQLFPYDFSSEVFGLFRSWHNRRSLRPGGPWSRLTLALAHATEAYLFITNLDQSPFNVGIRVTLQDFTPEQVAKLNQLYGSPLRDDTQLARYVRVVSGHPYLVRRGLEEMATESISIDTLEAQADRDEGIFGDHLRRLLVSLVQDGDLCDVVRGLLQNAPCPTSEAFYRLRAAGVVSGESAEDARFRCQLYETYLARHLL